MLNCLLSFQIDRIRRHQSIMSAWYKRSKLVLDTCLNMLKKSAGEMKTWTPLKSDKIVVYSGAAILFVINNNVQMNPYSSKLKFQFVVVPRYLEIKVGEWTVKKMKEEFKENVLPQEHPHTMRVRLIASKLFQSEVFRFSSRLSPDPEYEKWDVIVIDRPIVKASCYAGNIVIFTGLLDRLESDAEIATVIGHEVGHDVARHTSEKIKKLPWVACRSLFLWVISRWVISRPVPFDQIHHCFRKIEREADYIGALLMASAGYDPTVAPTVYARLSEDMVPSHICSACPTARKRAALLSRPEIMNGLVNLYCSHSGENS